MGVAMATKTRATAGTVGACLECGGPMRVTALERVRETDTTRVGGGQPGHLGWRNPDDLVSRVECAAGHVWWLALDG